MSKPMTRAQAYGVSAKILNRKSRRVLTQVEVALQGLSFAWSEVDAGFSADLEDLIDKINDIDGDGGALQEAIERLAEPWGDD